MANTSSASASRPAKVGVALGTLLATIWVASQGDVVPFELGKFAAVLVLLFDSLPMLLAMWVGAAGLGYPLRMLLVPELARGRGVVQLGLGMALLLLLAWGLAWAGQLHQVTAWGLCGAGAGLLVVALVVRLRSRRGARAKAPGVALSSMPAWEGQEQRPEAEEEEERWPWAWVLWMPGLGLLLTAAACPPGTLWQVEAFGYDVLSYHLQLPREWLGLGAMAGLEHNVYSYLPSLMEAGYMQLGAMRGSVREAIYTAQLFHVSLAVLAAAGVAQAARHFVGRGPSVAAGAVMLSVPWVLVTGSLAYNEMAVLAFGAVALVILFDLSTERWGGAAALGFLVGAATLAKLTAGFFLAVPVALVLLTRWNHALRWRMPPPWPVGVKAAAVAALAGTLTLTPYLVRNYTWTGNPVFPFATGTLGMGHWDEQLKQRWDAGHGLAWDEASRLEAFYRQWLLNTGYGALGGFDVLPESRNIARFEKEGGFPLLWVVLLGSALLCVRRPGLRRAVAAMGLVLVAQFAFWFLATHLQSRFLIPTLLPAVLVAGVGMGRLAELTRHRVAWLWPLTAGLLVLLLSLSGLTVLFGQTQRLQLEDGRRVPAPLWLVIDSLPNGQKSGRISGVARHPINALPEDSRTLLVADSSPLLYLSRPFVYHTAFDRSPLGEMIREAEGEPEAVNALLRKAGITHVWVHWAELARLHGTYGHDADVTEAMLGKLIATGWRPVSESGRAATLFALP